MLLHLPRTNSSPLSNPTLGIDQGQSHHVEAVLKYWWVASLQRAANLSIRYPSPWMAHAIQCSWLKMTLLQKDTSSWSLANLCHGLLCKEQVYYLDAGPCSTHAALSGCSTISIKKVLPLSLKWVQVATLCCKPYLCTPDRGCSLNVLRLCQLPVHLPAPHQWFRVKMDAPPSPTTPAVYYPPAKLSGQSAMSPEDECSPMLPLNMLPMLPLALPLLTTELLLNYGEVGNWLLPYTNIPVNLEAS